MMVTVMVGWVCGVMVMGENKEPARSLVTRPAPFGCVVVITGG